ncbi:hypothetical protein LC55x_4016 [Lysobacter capsici]|nr:hypothetical protein LC55x_4016 [Lysobacter capsici]
MSADGHRLKPPKEPRARQSGPVRRRQRREAASPGRFTDAYPARGRPASFDSR